MTPEKRDRLAVKIFQIVEGEAEGALCDLGFAYYHTRCDRRNGVAFPRMIASVAIFSLFVDYYVSSLTGAVKE